MGKLYKILLFSFFLIFHINGLSGQVDFQIDQEEDGSFVVKLVPSVNWEGKESITVTAQVTIVAPPNTEVETMKSLKGEWQKSGVFSKPNENPEATYMVFGLVSLATSQIQYVEGEEVALFTFTLKGECNGSIQLMENDDPFMAPNSLNVNVGNQITTFGSGNTNAFNENIGVIDCR